MENYAKSHMMAVEPESPQMIFSETRFEQSSELVNLLASYYEYLNKKGNVSYIINNMIRNHNIDKADQEYLDSIGALIGRNIPRAHAVSQQKLLSVISDFYTKRGSVDSIHAFFRIFYNTEVSIKYPKDVLLKPSSTPDHSAVSGNTKIQDSYYWQDFSYVLNARGDSTSWQKEYKSFIHPAGLKYFIDLEIDSSNENKWIYMPDVPFRPYTQLYPPDSRLHFKEVFPLANRENPRDYWKYIKWPEASTSLIPVLQPTIYYNPTFMGIEQGINNPFVDKFSGEYWIHRSMSNPDYATADALRRVFPIVLDKTLVAKNPPVFSEMFHNYFVEGGWHNDEGSHADGYSPVKMKNAKVIGRGSGKTEFFAHSAIILDGDYNARTNSYFKLTVQTDKDVQQMESGWGFKPNAGRRLNDVPFSTSTSRPVYEWAIDMKTGKIVWRHILGQTQTTEPYWRNIAEPDVVDGEASGIIVEQTDDEVTPDGFFIPLVYRRDGVPQLPEELPEIIQ